MNEQTFWESIKLDYPNECWEWQCYKDGDGYGTLSWDGGMQKSHRVAYCLENDIDLSEIHDKCVCHSCDNPPCCNSKHLFCGTHQDNIDDMVTKGRSGDRGRGNHARGIKSGRSKFNEQDIKDIRKLAKNETITSIALQLGVVWSTIDCIVKKRTWKHV